MEKSSGHGKKKRRSFTGISSKWREYLSERAILYLAEGAGLSASIAWLFYQSKSAMLLLSPLAVPYCMYRMQGDRQKERRILSGQFRELLDSVNNAMRAGDSPENAFREGYKDMLYEYGEYAPVTKEMSRVIGGLDNRISLEKLLEEFADRAGTEEIREFAEVFRIAKRGGGNMTEILSRTAVLIEGRLDVENEINIMLGNRRIEQRIMDVTPFLIIFYIGVTSPGFFDVLYHNPEGIVFMTLCLLAYFGALILSERILAVPI